jgi:HPr kinase/phosphorylase
MIRTPQTVHGTAVSINGNGVLLLGCSGSGKTDLALRLIDRGATLICDDRVIVDTHTSPPTLHQAPNIIGKLEVRGLGIVDFPAVNAIPLFLCVMLDEEPERMPNLDTKHMIESVAIAKLCLNAFTASAPIKVELAIKSLVDQSDEPLALV